MADALGLLALLIGLELVLGVDNVLVIAIFVARLPEEKRQRARVIGLALAMVARIVMLAVVATLAGLTDPLFWELSVRDLILLTVEAQRRSNDSRYTLSHLDKGRLIVKRADNRSAENSHLAVLL